MILIADFTDIWARQPPSLEQTWMMHRHHAELWRQKYAPPPPVPTVHEWGQPVQVVKRQKAEAAQPVPVKGSLGWPGKARYAWACLHLAVTAAIYLLCWLTEKPACLQLAATSVALARRGAWHQLLSGDSLAHCQPPSLAQTWERHTRSARQLNAVALRWPRYCWGVAHISLQAVLYLFRWVAESAPKFLITVLAVALIIWTL